MFILNTFLLFGIFCVLKVSSSLSCLNEKGDEVDWFLLYKLPDEKYEESEGIEYLFITPSTVKEGWKLSVNQITDKESIPAKLLNPLYKNDSENIWILYNDQPPSGSKKQSRGHTKGVVGVNKDGGFWLVHSVPNFPPSPDEGDYSYPKSGQKYGQSFLCLSFSPEEIDNVGIQLQFNQVNVYWKQVHEDLEEQYPNLVEAANGKSVKRAPWNNSLVFNTKEGFEVHSFAKASKFSQDLYEDWVAPTLESDLYVESWLNGRGKLSSNCSKTYSVNNVEKVKICEVTQCTAFSSSNDHSKWAVSATLENPWLCVGDINRALSQEKRGGGTVCMKHEDIWQSYYHSVDSVQPCERKKHNFFGARILEYFHII